MVPRYMVILLHMVDGITQTKFKAKELRQFRKRKPLCLFSVLAIYNRLLNMTLAMSSQFAISLNMSKTTKGKTCAPFYKSKTDLK